jgi:hypothetical protein
MAITVSRLLSLSPLGARGPGYVRCRLSSPLPETGLQLSRRDFVHMVLVHECRGFICNLLLGSGTWDRDLWAVFGVVHFLALAVGV